MIIYILTKIIHKYKLYLSLMLGIISIIMVFSMIVMFQDGSEKKLIRRGFEEQREETGVYPALLSRSGDLTGKELAASLGADDTVTGFMQDKLDEYENAWKKALGIPIIASQRLVYYQNFEAEYSLRGGARVSLGYLDSSLASDGSSHFILLEEADENDPLPPAGSIPCYISRSTADSEDMVVGETVSFHKLGYDEEAREEPWLTLYVQGIISEADGDYFWGKSLEDMGFLFLIDKEDFEPFAKAHPKDIYFDQNVSFDYRYLTTENTDRAYRALKRLKKNDSDLSENLTPVIEHYRDSKKSVGQMLYVIVLPLTVLVVVFIGMISFRIIDSEHNELTTLKNRGLGRARLTGLYLLQSVFLALIGIPPGLILGYYFGRLMAGVEDFCGFSFGAGGISVRDYQFNPSCIYAGLAAAALSVLMMMIPVFVFFGKKRSRRKASVTPGWERRFLDVILLAVSCYLLYNYNKQLASLSEGVLSGEGIDPVIFINATLFLFACGMLMLRLIFYLVKLVYRIGAKRYAPVTYAGFLQILRTRKESGVISVFLVMTVAMSIFNAGLARTINANKEARLQYECGADLRIQEHWDVTLVKRGDTMDWKYHEPDYEAYQKQVADGLFDSITKVLLYDRIVIAQGKDNQSGTQLMGIHTKEFGETVTFRDGLLDRHWYHYLNDLAASPSGVLISKNMADHYSLKTGSRVAVKALPPKVTGKSEAFATADFTVAGIVDSWPGYVKYRYETDEKGKTVVKDNYLLVMNYATAVDSFAQLPYQVWAKTNVGKEAAEAALTESFGSSKRYIQEMDSWRDDLRQEKSSAIMQITNGIFTADFLVALLLCIIGYMIYWITSVRDRELLFGIYRAMGISRREINRMVGLEQIFLSMTSILAGVFAGSLALRLFVRVFAAVYLPKKHNLPVYLASQNMDLLQIGLVLLVVITVSILWIRGIVKKLNITEALKLGDD